MSGRDTILSKVRASLKAAAPDAAARRAEVAARLAAAPPGIIPKRAQLPADGRLALFKSKAERLAASVVQVASGADVPDAVVTYLRDHNLAASVRMGSDARLAAMPWERHKTLDIRKGASDGGDEVGVSHAFGGVAETGTIVMISGPANPSTINFLPEHHIVVVDAADVEGDLEAAIARVRTAFGKGTMPRTVNFVSGPSRSGDIEQKIILGAHGPRALHLIVVGG